MGSTATPNAVQDSGFEQDIVRAARGGGAKFGGTIVSRLAGLAVVIILTRLLGVVHFGQYRLAVVLMDLLAQVGDLGLRSSGLRFIPIAARERDEARLLGILRIVCVVPLFAGMLLAAFVFGFAEQIADEVFQDRTLASLLRVLCLAIPLTGAVNSGEAVTRAFSRIDYSVLGRDIAFPLSRVIVTFAVLIAGYGLFGAAIAHMAALLVAAVMLVVFVLRLIPRSHPGLRVRYPVRSIWQQSLPMYVTRLVEAFGRRIEILALGFFGMTAGVGLFAAALQMAQLGTMFFQALLAVSLPIISSAYTLGGAERIRPLWHTVTKWAVMATLPLFLAIVIFAEPLLGVFGAEFTAGRWGLILLSLVPLINASAGIGAGIIAMTGNARLNGVNAVVFLIVKIALSLLLIPRWDVVGAATAAVVATIVVNGMRLAELFVLFRLRPYDRSFLKPIAAALGAAAVAYGASQLAWLAHPILQLGIGLPALAAVYVGILVALGFSAEDRLILDRLKRRLRPGGRTGSADSR